MQTQLCTEENGSTLATATPTTDSATEQPTIPSLIEAAERRTEEWFSIFDPSNTFEFWMLGQLAMATVRLDADAQIDDALRKIRSLVATHLWDDERRIAAEYLGEKIHLHPARIARQLRRTRQGCQYLIEHWRYLDDYLNDRGVWDEKRRSRALDLLGVPLEGRDNPAKLPTNASLDDLKALVRNEIARLQRLESGPLAMIDARERAEAIAGRGPDSSPEARLQRRDEAAHRRALTWTRAQLGSVRDQTPASPRPSAASRVKPPMPPPPPRPEPIVEPVDLPISATSLAESGILEELGAKLPTLQKLSRRARRALEKRRKEKERQRSRQAATRA